MNLDQFISSGTVFFKLMILVPVPVAARLLRLWVRIPAGVWMFVCCECCVLSGRSPCDELITLPEESYRLWCVALCDLETSWMRGPFPTGGQLRQIKKNSSFADEACSHPYVIGYLHKNTTLASVWARLIRFLQLSLSTFRAGFELARFYDYAIRFV
jgi:hypothetical protein